MKHGRKPTLNQKKIIKSAGLNPDNWLIVKNLSNELHIAHRNTKSKRVVPVA
jgi:membrane-bound lytic murein transglycosylase MltF